MTRSGERDRKYSYVLDYENSPSKNYYVIFKLNERVS